MDEAKIKAINETMQAWADARVPFLQTLPKGGIWAEIGVFMGQFSRHILDIVQPQSLILVDSWKYDQKTGDRTQEQMEDMLDAVIEKYRDLPNVSIMRMTSVEFFSQMPEGFLDGVYIDACHELHAVLSDLFGAWKVVKPGGVIAGDDFGPSKDWGNDVETAVKILCQEMVTNYDLYRVLPEDTTGRLKFIKDLHQYVIER